MSRIALPLVLLMAAGWLLVLAGCGSSPPATKTVVVAKAPAKTAGHGPPPHAPAHGYRAKYNGVDLVYDSGIEVYVVTTVKGRYYWGDHFYRRRGNVWLKSKSLGGQWVAVGKSNIPVALRTGKAKKHAKAATRANEE